MARAFYIPDGPKNLASIFPGVDFSQVQDYYIQVYSGATVIATSPVNQMNGECCDDKFRLHFQNYLGAIDAINFKLDSEDHEAKSDSYFRPLQSPLVKSRHSNNRFNVKAGDTFNLITTDYTQDDKEWLQEAFDSPLAWMEWLGTQGQDDDYIPVIVIDVKFPKVTQEDRFNYEVAIQVKISNEKIIIRN